MKQSSANYTEVAWDKITVHTRDRSLWRDHRIYPAIVHDLDGSPFTIFGHRGIKLAEGGPYAHAGEARLQLRKFLYYVYNGEEFFE